MSVQTSSIWKIQFYFHQFRQKNSLRFLQPTYRPFWLSFKFSAVKKKSSFFHFSQNEAFILRLDNLSMLVWVCVIACVAVCEKKIWITTTNVTSHTNEYYSNTTNLLVNFPTIKSCFFATAPIELHIHTQIQLPTHLTLGTCTPIYSSDWIRRIFFFTKMMKTVCVWVNSVDIWMGCYILILRIHSLRSLRVCLCWCFVLSCSHPTRITIAHNIFTYFSFLLLVMAKWNR